MVEVLVAAGLLGIATAALTSMITYAYNLASRKKYRDAISQYRDNVIRSVNSRVGWEQTVTANGIQCLTRNSTGCAGLVTLSPVSIFDGSGRALTGRTTDNVGFDVNQSPCVFTPNSTCPMRYLVQWQPVCDSAACLNPTINVVGRAEINPNFASYLPSSAPYDFDFIRGSDISNARSHCESLGGVFNSTTNKCALTTLVGTCPQGQIVTGVNADRTLICTPFLNAECPADHYATSIDRNGNFFCKSLTALAACAVSTYPMSYSEGPATTTTYGGGGDGGDCGGDGGGDCD